MERERKNAIKDLFLDKLQLFDLYGRSGRTAQLHDKFHRYKTFIVRNAGNGIAEQLEELFLLAYEIIREETEVYFEHGYNLGIITGVDAVNDLRNLLGDDDKKKRRDDSGELTPFRPTL